jgi:hypothetical protein
MSKKSIDQSPTSVYGANPLGDDGEMHGMTQQIMCDNVTQQIMLFVCTYFMRKKGGEDTRRPGSHKQSMNHKGL